jgi:hypothetical protein
MRWVYDGVVKSAQGAQTGEANSYVKHDVFGVLKLVRRAGQEDGYNNRGRFLVQEWTGTARGQERWVTPGHMFACAAPAGAPPEVLPEGARRQRASTRNVGEGARMHSRQCRPRRGCVRVGGGPRSLSRRKGKER